MATAHTARVPVCQSHVGLGSCGSDLVRRSKDLIEQVTHGILSLQPPVQECRVTCCVTMEDVPLATARTTPCGHVVARYALKEWWIDQRKQTCPVCRAEDREMDLEHQLDAELWTAIAQDLQQPNKASQVAVIQLQDRRIVNIDPSIAEAALTEARCCAEKEMYKEALDAYTCLFELVRSAEHYRGVPLLYDGLNQPRKALLSRFYLLSYLLEEGKIQDALSELRNISVDQLPEGTISSRIQSLRHHLTLQCESSIESIRSAMAWADGLDPEERVALYTQIFALKSCPLQAYSRLIELTEDPMEQRKLCKIASARAEASGQKEEAMAFEKQAEGIRLTEKSVLTQEVWKKRKEINWSLWYSSEVKAFLARMKEFGKLEERFVMIPIFSSMSLDGKTKIPLDLDKLDARSREKGAHRQSEESFTSPIRYAEGELLQWMVVEILDDQQPGEHAPSSWEKTLYALWTDDSQEQRRISVQYIKERAIKDKKNVLTMC